MVKIEVSDEIYQHWLDGNYQKDIDGDWFCRFCGLMDGHFDYCPHKIALEHQREGE